MDSTLILVKVITLIFKESLLTDKSTNSASVIKDTLDALVFPDSGVDFDRSKHILTSLRSTALWMLEHDASHVFDRASLLQRIRVNVEGDEWMYEAIRTAIEESPDEETLKSQTSTLRHELRSSLHKTKVTEIMKRNAHRLIFQPDTVPDLRSYIREVNSLLEPYDIGIDSAKAEGHIDSVDFGDIDGLARIIKEGQQQTSTDGILITGWQGLNRATGEHRGLRRGEMIVVPALQHNWKTGFCLTTFVHIAMFNTPWLINPTKKPCLVWLSLENDLTINILSIYQYLKEIETGQLCDINIVKTMSKEDAERYIYEAGQYITSYLTKTGYTIKMERWDPSKTTYHTIMDYISRLEDQGYEIHALFIDYLNMISKAGCNGATAGADIRDLFRRMRNFCGPRHITCVTPHQLSPDAKRLVRANVEDLVREVVGKGYYDGCTTVDQEVDMEIYIHIAKSQGRSYLTVQIGKHRKLRPTPEKDRYFVLPFHDIGAIRPDLNGRDSSSRVVGGCPVGSGEEKPWFV